MKFEKALQEKKFELEKGDIILTGKFKNKKVEIEDFDVDDNDQPIVKTNKGDRKIFSFRVNKLMPKDKRK